MSDHSNEVVVTPEAMGAAGAVSYWRLGGPLNIAALAAAWTKAGLDPKLLRGAPEPETALRRAVMMQQDRHRLVRALSKKAEWAIVDEHIAEGQPPTFNTLVIVRAGATNPEVERVASELSDVEVGTFLHVLTAAFVAQQGTLQPDDVGTWLVKLAYKFGALALRDSGGVYFIPRPAMDMWNKAADVIETVSGKTHKIFRIPAMKNAEAVEAIIDAVTAEAEQVAKAIEDEVAAGLGDRALSTRGGVVQALLAKVGSYEELVGQQIKVRDRVEALAAAVAEARLSATQEEAA